MPAGVALRQKRIELGLTQDDLAKRMDTSRSSVMRLEERVFKHVSTLQEYVHALGGTLNIIATFPDGDIRINQFDPPKRKR